MYKILIRYNDKHDIWKVHSTESRVCSAFGADTTCTEYETDDIEELKKEVLRLDAIYGHENIRVIKDITAKYDVKFEEVFSASFNRQ